MKGENNMGRIIFETRSVCWWTGKQEEGLLGVQSHHYTHLDVVVEVIEVQSSVFFEFCLDQEFIEVW